MRKPRLLVACEFSGTVRDTFIKKGWDAMSCDLLPTEAPGPHHQGDVLEILGDGWDMMIAHPPCTHLAVSGAAWFNKKREQQREALEFVRKLMDAPIDRIAIENPVGIISTAIKPPSQTIHPYWFGHSEMKSTCLWLKGLPLLTPTRVVDKGPIHIHASGKRSSDWSMRTFKLPPSLRWKERSKTFQGIADAMAEQWHYWPDWPALPLFQQESA